MDRIYTVTINGRTLESQNLRELLARAVGAKRNLRMGRAFNPRFHSKISTEETAASYSGSEIAAVNG